jgi:aminopeptidase N
MQDGHEEYVNSTHPSSYPTLEVLKNVTIKDLIQSWTTKSGYPLVRVKFDEARGLLRFSQVISRTRAFYISI